MKNNTFVIVILLAFTLFSKDLLSQRNIGKIQTFYDGLNSSNLIKKQADFNLKGNVKQVTELSFPKQDSTVLQFNNKGMLELETNSETKASTRYTFALDRLQTISFEDYYSRSQKKFDYFGLIVEEVFDSKNTTDTFHREARYIHYTVLNELQIAYSYNRDTSRYDLVLFDYYKFMFDVDMKIIEEQKHSRRTGQPNILNSYWGTTVEYDYYPNSALLKKVESTEICATANSCPSYEISIAYDNDGNMISQALSDRTIRNSNWSGSYSWWVKYNENGDILEENYVDQEDQQKYLAERILNSQGKKKKNKKVKVVQIPVKLYDYEYDSTGNWIKKYEILDKERKLIKSRAIEYYL